MAETLPISRNQDVVILTRMVPRLIIQVLVSRFQVLPRAPLEQPDGFINGVLLSSIAVSLKILIRISGSAPTYLQILRKPSRPVRFEFPA